MKKNYVTPAMEKEIILAEELLIEGSGIEMGGEGDPDSKERMIRERLIEELIEAEQSIW